MSELRMLTQIGDLLKYETSKIEWKSSAAGRNDPELKRALKTLVAFTNNLLGEPGPGVVVFGVDNAALFAGDLEGGTPGLAPREADELEQKLRGWAQTRVKGALSLKTEHVGLPHRPGRALLLVTVEPDGELRYYEDALPVREGSSTSEATAANGLLQQLLRRVARPSEQWDQPLRGVGLEVLDEHLLTVELPRYSGGRSAAELLRAEARLDAALGGRLCAPDPSQGGRLAPTRLAALLLTQEPARHVSGAWTEVVQWAGASRSSTARRWRFTSPLIQQFAEVEHRLHDLNPEVVGAHDPAEPGQQNQRLYSPAALHEALANAYAHRDWASDAEVRVEVFPDRIEVSSPGGLPATVDLDRWREGHAQPSWRNGPLAAALTAANITNRLGKGVSILVEETRRVAGRAPDFRREPDRFTVILPAWRPAREAVAWGQPGVAVVSVGGESIERWVRGSLEAMGLAGAPVVVSWHRPGYIQGDAEAWERIAEELKQEFLSVIEDRNLGSMHLFFKGPVALAVLIGALVPQVKPLVVYHFEDGRYHRAFTLDRRFLRS